MSYRPIKVTVLTPTGTVEYDDGDLVVLHGKDGDEGYMRDHVPTLTEIVPSTMRYRVVDKDGHETWRLICLTAGYAEILPERVTVVVHAAELPHEVDKARAERALERAEARLKRPDASELDRRHARHAIRRAKARIAFADQVEHETNMR